MTSAPTSVARATRGPYVQPLARVGADVGRVADAVEQRQDVRVGRRVELPAARRDVLRDLVDDLAPPAPWQVAQLLVEALEVVLHQTVAGLVHDRSFLSTK